MYTSGCNFVILGNFLKEKKNMQTVLLSLQTMSHLFIFDTLFDLPCSDIVVIDKEKVSHKNSRI